MYPNDRVAQFINKNFVPIKIHVKEHPEAFGRFEAQWTPTLIVLDPEGKERYRFEGYLPPEDFLAQLEIGLAHQAFIQANLRLSTWSFDDSLRPVRGQPTTVLVRDNGLDTRASAMLDAVRAFRPNLVKP